MLIEVKVGALIMDPNSSTPIVVLKGLDGESILPIWVGAYEANAIALEIEKIVPQRPMTHDLLRNTIIEMGFILKRVIINDLMDNTFYATIELEDGSKKTLGLDARPSDAIALALRTDCPIFITQKVLELSNASSASTAKPAPEAEFEETPKPTEDWPDVIG